MTFPTTNAANVRSINGQSGDIVLAQIGIQVDDQSGPTDDVKIEAAITMAAALGNGTRVVFGPRVYTIANLHIFDGIVPVGQGATTIIRATNAAAGIRIGTALGTGNPRNLNELVRCGDFNFDGNGLSTVGVQTKTTNWRYVGITIYGCAAGTNALSVWGQNNHYDVWPVSKGTGFCIAFDNGAGGNRVRGKVNGTNFVLFDQTVTQSTDYYVPTDNILDGLISDQSAGDVADPASQYCILQRFGQHNVLRDSNLYHAKALAGVKFERGAGGVVPAGHDWNGNFSLAGRNELTLPAAGAYGVWADFVSGGVAGQAGPFNNVMVQASGSVLVGGGADGVKWGVSNPFVSAGCYWPTGATWTTDGSGAASRPRGPLVTDSKTGIGRFPILHGLEFPTGEVVDATHSGSVQQSNTASDSAVGDKIALYGNVNLGTRYGIGVQANALVLYLQDTARVSVRESPALGAASVGSGNLRPVEAADPVNATDLATKAYADTKTAFATGTLAARPAAGTLGRLYYETTTPALTFDNGSVWKTVTLT